MANVHTHMTVLSILCSFLFVVSFFNSHPNLFIVHPIKFLKDTGSQGYSRTRGLRIPEPSYVLLLPAVHGSMRNERLIVSKFQLWFINFTRSIYLSVSKNSRTN